MSNLGRRVELARKTLGLTRAELSSRIKMSEGSLRDLEILNSTPRGLQELLPSLSVELKKSVGFLLTGHSNTSAPLIKEAEKIKASAEKIISCLD